MSWLSRVRNGIPFLPKRQSSDNLWHKCKKCEAMVFTKEWEENLFVCPRCEHHDRIGPTPRLYQTSTWREPASWVRAICRAARYCSGEATK